jgi:WD40 repeat protein
MELHVTYSKESSPPCMVFCDLCLPTSDLHYRIFSSVAFLPTFSLYTFDTRKLKQPLQVHMDHVAAVTAIDYAPTGKEFVSGGYDKSVRIFEHGKVNSKCLTLM